MPRTRADVYAEPIEALSEDELQDLLKQFRKRFKRLEDQYLVMIGEQLRDIGSLAPSDVHRLEQFRRMNRNLSTIEHRIGRTVGMSASEVDKLLRACASNDARIAGQILGAKDVVKVKDNPYLERVLEAQKRETGGTMKNLSNTTVVSDFYRKAVDEAVQAAQSGVEDYNTAIRRVVREAGEHGLRVRESKDGTRTRVVDYESGYSRRLDTAARMNVLDGMRHMNQNIMNAVGEQFGANGVEIDAHMLCAEDHIPYQGLQYSNEEFEDIQDSLDRPFGEWNCRHSWHPIILGISPRNYTDEQLEEMKTYSRERIEIDGRTKTRYEWSQEMRRVETAIRQQKDTANLAKSSGDKTLSDRCRANVLRLNKYYQQVSSTSGLKPQMNRTYVPGYRDAKSTNVLTNTSNSGTMYMNRFGDNSYSNRIPMPKERFDRIIAGFAKNGGIISCDQNAQELLDFNERQNGGKPVFASALNENTIITRPNPTAAELFEELIHTTQYKRGLTDGSEPSHTRCEIIAQKKLIAHAKAYGISDYDLEITKHNLDVYREMWRKMTGEEWIDSEEDAKGF